MPLFSLHLDGQMFDRDARRVFPERVETNDWRTGLIVNGKEYVVTDTDDKIGGNIEIDCEPIEALRYQVSIRRDGPAEHFADVDDALAWLSERTGEPGGSVDWLAGYDFNEPVEVHGWNEKWIGNIQRVIVKQPAEAPGSTR